MNPKHIILTLLLMLCPIGMAAQSTITRHKPKPTVTKHKPAAKPKAKPTPRRNSSTTGLSAELNKLINNMVYVSGGTFIMGGDDSSDQMPTHSVTLSSYYICKYEVTQALWRAVMGSNPSNFKGDNLPVEWVSWNDCQTFINRLNSYTGRNFRLPTEAEWEFAARGGNYSRHYKYSGSNYISDVAWYCDNSGNRTPPRWHQAGQRTRPVRHERQCVGMVQRLVRLIQFLLAKQPYRGNQWVWPRGTRWQLVRPRQVLLLVAP